MNSNLNYHSGVINNYMMQYNTTACNAAKLSMSYCKVIQNIWRIITIGDIIGSLVLNLTDWGYFLSMVENWTWKIWKRLNGSNVKQISRLIS